MIDLNGYLHYAINRIYRRVGQNLHLLRRLELITHQCTYH